MVGVILFFFTVFMCIITCLAPYVVVYGAKLRYTYLQTALIIALESGILILLSYALGGITISILGIVGGSLTPFLLEESRKKWYGLFVPTLGGVVTIESLVIFCIKVHGKNMGNVFVDEYIARYISFAVCLGLLWIIHFFERKKEITDLSIAQIILLHLCTVIIALCMGEASIIYSRISNQKSGTIFTIAIMLMCVVFYALAIYAVFLDSRFYKEKSIINHQKEILDAQKIQIEEILENEKRLHSYRHDLNAHICALAALADVGNIFQIKKYCAGLIENAENYNKTVISGNIAVDGILGRGMNRCKEKKISVESNVVVIHEGKVTDYELCIIFSNILNNIEEACIEGDKAKIVCYPYNDCLCILEKNPIHKELQFNGKIPKTSKDDKVTHGHGIENIKAVVDKYEGYMNIKVEKGMFNMEILL